MKEGGTQSSSDMLGGERDRKTADPLRVGGARDKAWRENSGDARSLHTSVGAPLSIGLSTIHVMLGILLAWKSRVVVRQRHTLMNDNKICLLHRHSYRSPRVGQYRVRLVRAELVVAVILCMQSGVTGMQ
jgi:hypothetical protein